MGIYKLKLKKGCNEITTVEDWYKLAPPKKADIHWKDGRSAKELSKYMLGEYGYIPKEIEDILSEIGCNKEKIIYGEPEAVTRLIGKGEGRNHDILLVQDDQAVISIEAKVDEELGKYVSKELNDKISENKLRRIKSLYNDIYGCYEEADKNIRYQLITATSGTLIEAKKNDTNKAVLIILTLKKDGCYKNKKIEKNYNDIKYFIQSLEMFKTDDSYKLPGYQEIDFYIRYIEIKL